MSKPKPVPKTLVCSECGLDWDKDNPHTSKSDCIAALKNKLNNRSSVWYSCNCSGHCSGCSCFQTVYTWPNWSLTGNTTDYAITYSNTAQGIN